MNKTDRLKARVAAGDLSVDEARMRMGKKPWNLPQTDTRFKITSRGLIPVYDDRGKNK